MSSNEVKVTPDGRGGMDSCSTDIKLLLLLLFEQYGFVDTIRAPCLSFEKCFFSCNSTQHKQPLLTAQRINKDDFFFNNECRHKPHCRRSTQTPCCEQKQPYNKNGNRNAYKLSDKIINKQRLIKNTSTEKQNGGSTYEALLMRSLN